MKTIHRCGALLWSQALTLVMSASGLETAATAKLPAQKAQVALRAWMRPNSR